jgi:YHS domain-containing protein
MLRILGLLLAFIFLVPLIRGIIGIVTRLFSAGGSSGGGRPEEKPRIPASEVLRKDPVCGTYVSESVAVKAKSNGETVYFCSEDCRRKFLEKT